MSKVIAVVGATGAQGGGLARAILSDTRGEFLVRAITRDAGSDAARKLRGAGAEVVEADLDDLGSLHRAFAGAYGVYGVTNFWEHMSVDKELAQARNIAEASRSAGVKHVIWSSLDDTRKLCPLSDTRMPTLREKYKVPHFDGKGQANAFFAGLPVTILNTAFYWENLINFGMGPKRGPDGKLVMSLPMGGARLPGICVEDIGKCAYGIFKRGGELIGKTVGICGDAPTVADMAATIGAEIGQPVEYQPMSPRDYAALGFPGADDLANMFQFYRDFEGPFVASRDVGLSRTLNPELLSFRQWVKANIAKLPGLGGSIRGHFSVRVADYDSWRKGFDSRAETRRSKGALRVDVYRDATDPHRVYVDVDFADLSTAQSYRDWVQNRILASEPMSDNFTATLLNLGNAQGSHEMQPGASIRALVSHRVSDYDKWHKMFEGAAHIREANGALAANVFRDAVDASNVHIQVDFRDLSGAQAHKAFLEKALAGAPHPSGINLGTLVDPSTLRVDFMTVA